MYWSILICQTNSSTCETKIIPHSKASNASAITGICLKFIWFVGSSKIIIQGFKNTNLQNATNHFNHSDK